MAAVDRADPVDLAALVAAGKVDSVDLAAAPVARAAKAADRDSHHNSPPLNPDTFLFCSLKTPALSALGVFLFLLKQQLKLRPPDNFVVIGIQQDSVAVVGDRRAVGQIRRINRQLGVVSIQIVAHAGANHVYVVRHI